MYNVSIYINQSTGVRNLVCLHKTWRPDRFCSTTQTRHVKGETWRTDEREIQLLHVSVLLFYIDKEPTVVKSSHTHTHTCKKQVCAHVHTHTQRKHHLKYQTQNPQTHHKAVSLRKSILTIYTDRRVNMNVWGVKVEFVLVIRWTDGCWWGRNQDGAPVHFVMRRGAVAPPT